MYRSESRTLVEMVISVTGEKSDEISEASRERNGQGTRRRLEEGGGTEAR